MPKSWNLRDSWFIVAFYLVDGLSANAKVLVRKLLDGYHKELLRNMGYLGGRGCQPLNQLLLCSAASLPLSIDI